MAYMLPFVVSPKLAILPTDPQVAQEVHGTGFNVLLPRSVKEGGTHNYYGVSVTSKVFVSLDRHTSLANNCSGDYLQTEKGVTGARIIHKGYVFNFPSATKKRSYAVRMGARPG
jgi:hypothetical protein